MSYFGIGIEHTKTETNVGSLWRTAHILGAAFCFTIGRRYKRQSSDTTNAVNQIPLYHYDSLHDLMRGLPVGCQLVGLELHPAARPIATFVHPRTCCYLLGSEDGGLTPKAIDVCHSLVQLPGDCSLNVAVAGSIVIYDRIQKEAARVTGFGRAA